MKRPLLALSLSCLACAAHAQTADRYSAGLRGDAGVTTTAMPQRLLSWPSKTTVLRGRADAVIQQPSPAARSYSQSVGRPAFVMQSDRPAPLRETTAPTTVPTPPQAFAYAAPARSTAQPGTYEPQTPRRYSVGREFGVQPDAIKMPAPSVLAFGPDVGAAFAAQNAKDAGETTLNPADLDQVEQAEQDDARREARQKMRDKAQAAKNAS